MAYTIDGSIQKIGEIENIPYGDKVFRKRELVLDCSYRNRFSGDLERPNFPRFEFTGDHVDDLNFYKKGDIVTVTFVLSGSRTEKGGVERYFTNINGYKIEPYRSSRKNNITDELKRETAKAIVEPTKAESNDDLPF